MTAERLLDDTIRMAPGIYGVPIVHGSAEFTVFIRRLILETPPRYIAVELPENMGPYIEKCLPYADAIPVISTIPNDETEPEMHFIMEPLEPIVEAVRSAHDFGIPVHYADIFSEYLAGLDPETFPDTYALKTTGVKGMYEEYIRSSGTDTVSENPLTYIESLDRIREIKMARDLRYLSGMIPGDDEELPGIIFVCGFRHMRNIISYLSMSEEDFSQYSGLIRESGLENALDGEEEPLEAMLKLRDSAAAGPDYNITVLSEESSEVLHQPGYFNSAWVLLRKHPQYANHFSRLDLQRQAYRDAVQRYETESGELIPPQIQKLYFRFARNWSILENRLLPDLYKLVISARSFHNDNFARILYDVLSHMPPHSPAPFPVRKLTLDDLYKDSRLIRFRLREKKRRRIPPPKLIKRFKKEKFPGEWREIQDNSICSYPPEDIIIEDFGHYLKAKANTMMSGYDQKTVQFSSSLLDGIDYRETIRNIHVNRIFVKDIVSRGIDAGSVVIIFSEDFEEHPWEMIWWGEHNQESDMAFYATPVGEHMAGPGIYRCQYGGLLMTYPPGRLHDIWQDDYYSQFTNPADRLLAAAIEYNDKNAVVHLSNRPPLPMLSAAAGRIGQRIIHIPLTSVDPVRLGRVRRFHVLDSKERRDEADDYVW